MAITRFVTENENNIKDAMISGVSGTAIEATLQNIMDKIKGTAPTQFKKAVDAIVNMKRGNAEEINPNYTSDYVRKNSGKITSALNDGLSSSEITASLIVSSNKANTKEAKRDLKFQISLVSKIKQMEKFISYQNQNTNSYQKIKS